MHTLATSLLTATASAILASGLGAQQYCVLMIQRDSSYAGDCSRASAPEDARILRSALGHLPDSTAWRRGGESRNGAPETTFAQIRSLIVDALARVDKDLQER